MNPVILSLETGNPERYVRGREAYNYFHSRKLSPTEEHLYGKVLLEGPIEGRHTAIHHDRYSCDLSQDQLIEQFAVEGRDLIFRTASKTLQKAQCSAEQICAVIVNTCTGYLCPGLSSHIAEDLHLSASTQVYDLMGMGCGAALPNLHLAMRLLRRPEDRVLSVAVEICSATLFLGRDPGCIISNCIFGDGAAAAVIGAASNKNSSAVCLIDFESGIFPQYRQSLRYVSDGGKLRNVLSRRVPEIGAQTVRTVAQRLLDRMGMKISDIDFWAVHPGGVRVIDQIAKEFELDETALKFSRTVFTKYGNMSSPSVLFVLKEILNTARPDRGRKCMMLSFGAGFTAYALLAEFR